MAGKWFCWINKFQIRYFNFRTQESKLGVHLREAWLAQQRTWLVWVIYWLICLSIFMVRKWGKMHWYIGTVSDPHERKWSLQSFCFCFLGSSSSTGLVPFMSVHMLLVLKLMIDHLGCDNEIRWIVIINRHEWGKKRKRRRKLEKWVIIFNGAYILMISYVYQLLQYPEFSIIYLLSD